MQVSQSRMGYTRFWPTILYQYYTEGNNHYTIQYQYQYYTNFSRGVCACMLVRYMGQKLLKSKGNQHYTISYHELLFRRYDKSNTRLDFTCLIHKSLTQVMCARLTLCYKSSSVFTAGLLV